ncbi:MAG: cation transporter [Chloroflexi bacterium]|nr:cation transporter [Chloroflexota bacterium]
MFNDLFSDKNSDRHKHGHQHDTHSHTHGAIDPSILTTQRGMWAVKWSLLVLLATAFLQIVVVYFSGSVALLADTIHNFGDAATAVPLAIAFILARWKATKRFTYGYGRVEDLAGVAIVLIILVSAIVGSYESINRFLHPQTVGYLWAVAVASVIGFSGNEAVATLRIRVGKEIGSAALVADGNHARVDGLTSLAVLFGVVGVWLGFPLADPIIGLIITAAILRIVWESARAVFARLLDGVDPVVIEEIEHAVNHTEGVLAVSEVRVRWLGHRLHAEVNIAVAPDLSVGKGHDIAKEVRHQLLHGLRYLSNATIHVDPVDASGEEHHSIEGHEHSGLSRHGH